MTNDKEAVGFTLIPYCMMQNYARLRWAMEDQYRRAAACGNAKLWGSDPNVAMYA